MQPKPSPAQLRPQEVTERSSRPSLAPLDRLMLEPVCRRMPTQRRTLYLDLADLARISDGKGSHVDVLREAILANDACLLVSQAHIFDLANADDATRLRWATTAVQLADVVYAHKPGEKTPATADNLLSLFKDYEEHFRTLNILRALELNAINELRNADATLRAEFQARPSKDKRKALRELAETQKELLPGVGKTADQIVEDVLATPLQAIEARGDVGEYIRRRRIADRSRVPLASDVFDELHVSFAVYADVLTVDKNVADLLAAAQPALLKRGLSFRVVRVGRLDEVAKALYAP